MSAQNRIRLPGLILLVMLVLSFASNTAHATDAANRQQAIEIALQQSGANGKVLGVKTEKNKNGQTVYAVKVLSEGRVRVIRVRQSR